LLGSNREKGIKGNAIVDHLGLCNIEANQKFEAGQIQSEPKFYAHWVSIILIVPMSMGVSRIPTLLM
jgi:hypothetical protein